MDLRLYEYSAIEDLKIDDKKSIFSISHYCLYQQVKINFFKTTFKMSSAPRNLGVFQFGFFYFETITSVLRWSWRLSSSATTMDKNTNTRVLSLIFYFRVQQKGKVTGNRVIRYDKEEEKTHTHDTMTTSWRRRRGKEGNNTTRTWESFKRESRQ